MLKTYQIYDKFDAGGFSGHQMRIWKFMIDMADEIFWYQRILAKIWYVPASKWPIMNLKFFYTESLDAFVSVFLSVTNYRDPNYCGRDGPKNRLMSYNFFLLIIFRFKFLGLLLPKKYKSVVLQEVDYSSLVGHINLLNKISYNNFTALDIFCGEYEQFISWGNNSRLHCEKWIRKKI